LAELLDQPTDQAALPDDAEEARVREQVADLARSPRHAAVRVAALGEQREVLREARERELEEEELQAQVEEAGPAEEVGVDLPVEGGDAAAGWRRWRVRIIGYVGGRRLLARQQRVRADDARRRHAGRGEERRAEADRRERARDRGTEHEADAER